MTSKNPMSHLGNYTPPRLRAVILLFVRDRIAIVTDKAIDVQILQLVSLFRRCIVLILTELNAGTRIIHLCKPGNRRCLLP
jgi:hypothetical protein